MHSFKEFPEVVINAFSPLIVKYDLKFKTNGFHSVDITNQFVRLNFNMDRYNLQGFVFAHDFSLGFWIIRLIMFDRPNDFVLEKFPTSKYQGKNLVKNQMRHFAFFLINTWQVF